ncbi:alpha-amylase family glycosyl hydrolase, partial [Candidatus Nanopelagicales bacterium]|nr:alpha-amylase family glycosyl hydrolase [Candidatus Nanopelagicales bacterium]
TMADFDLLLATAHSKGLRVTIDIVPSHTSNEHRWFREAAASPPGSAARARYLFRHGRGANGERPPTDARSTFGGPAWSQVDGDAHAPGQWYFHLFAPEQPDLNWSNPEVLQEFEAVWRFWLDKGVDGFRIDVADHLTKDVDQPWKQAGSGLLDHSDASRTHTVWRRLREVLDDYEPPRMAVAEAWTTGADLDRYGRSEEFSLIFDFSFLLAGWDATGVAGAIGGVMDRRQRIGTTPTWVMDNHDMVRSASRYASTPAVGVARSRAMSLLMLALPGTCYLYQGQELGLPNVDDLPESVLADPIWERSGHTVRGRDGCRVPLPWSNNEPWFGFKPAGVAPWLPQPEIFAELTQANQETDLQSTWRLFKRALELRRHVFSEAAQAVHWHDSEAGVLVFSRDLPTAQVLILTNFSDEAVQIPPGRVLLTSDADQSQVLQPNNTVWVQTAPD